jgi:hypothetical protein
MGGQGMCVGRRAEDQRSVQYDEVGHLRATWTFRLASDGHATWARHTHFSHWSHLHASMLLLKTHRSPHSNTKNHRAKTAAGSVNSRRRTIASLVLGFPLALYCDCRTSRCHMLFKRPSSFDVE